MTCSSWLPDGRVDPVAAFFQLVALVDQQRDVAAVINDQFGTLAAGMSDRLVRAPPVFLQDSPFQAKTGTPVAAMAAAAWSCVEKMLQLAQRTLAPRSTRVSISTAVWMVMCSEPVMRTPASGFAWRTFADGHQAGHLVLGDGDLFAAPVGQPISATLYLVVVVGSDKTVLIRVNRLQVPG